MLFDNRCSKTFSSFFRAVSSVWTRMWKCSVVIVEYGQTHVWDAPQESGATCFFFSIPYRIYNFWAIIFSLHVATFMPWNVTFFWQLQTHLIKKNRNNKNPLKCRIFRHSQRRFFSWFPRGRCHKKNWALSLKVSECFCNSGFWLFSFLNF